MNVIAWILIGIWCAVGIYDVYLLLIGSPTISKQAEKYCSRLVDVVIVVVILGITWAFAGPKGFAFALSFTMLGHMLLGHETYKK